MKLFGGFSGKHYHGKGELPPAPEPEELSAAEDTAAEIAEALTGSEKPAEPTQAAKAADPAETTEPTEAAGPAEPAEEIGSDGAEAPANGPSTDTIVWRGRDAVPERSPEEQAEIEEMIRQYQRKKWIRRGVVLGVLVLIAAAILIVWKSTVKPPAIVQPTPTAAPGTPVPSTQPSAAPATPTPAENTPEPTEPPAPERQRRENVYSILILGHDQGNGNTDTMMVMQYDADAKEINVLSIPRDTCANVDSDESKNELKKISGIYARAGVEGVMDAVGDIIGAPLDGYVTVRLSGFIQLVDTIGGVDFDVPYYMNYDDPTQDLHIHYNTGMQHLTGNDAVKVVRWRQNNDANYGDLARIQVQQAFLATVAKKCLTLSNLATNLSEYVKIFETYVTTNLTNGNLIWFGQEFLGLSTEDIHFYTLPSNATDSIRGFAYGTILVDEWMEMLNEHFNVYDQPITLEDVDIISRDAGGNLYATSGEIRGGMESFLEYSVYIKRLEAWMKQQNQSSGSSAAGQSASSGNDGGAQEETGSESGTEPAPTAEPEPETASGGDTGDTGSEGEA